MKPFFVLIGTFVIALGAIRLIEGLTEWTLAARIALSIMLLFTAIGHFAFKKGMAMMVPAAIPYKAAIVFISGTIEIFAALALHIPSMQRATGWFLIVFFIMILPANIYAAVKRIDYQKGTNEGPGLRYLWFRIPFQLFLIAWTYLSTAR